MVGGDDDVGGRLEPQPLQRDAQPAEVVVGVPDRGERGRTVDAGLQRVRAVALVVLGAVRVARPEHQHEGPVGRLEAREEHVCGDVGEPVLLLHIGDVDAAEVGAGVQAAVRGERREAGGLDGGDDLGGQRQSFRVAGGVVHHQRRAAVAGGHVLDGGGTELADHGGLEPLGGGGRQQGVAPQVVSAEAGVHAAQDDVVLQEGDEREEAPLDRPGADIDGVGEVARVAHAVAGGDGGGVGRGERGELRVAVGEVHAFARHRPHVRRALRGHRAVAQSVGDEDHHVVRAVGGERGRG